MLFPLKVMLISKQRKERKSMVDCWFKRRLIEQIGHFFNVGSTAKLCSGFNGVHTHVLLISSFFYAFCVCFFLNAEAVCVTNKHSVRVYIVINIISLKFISILRVCYYNRQNSLNIQNLFQPFSYSYATTLYPIASTPIAAMGIKLPQQGLCPWLNRMR